MKMNGKANAMRTEIETEIDGNANVRNEMHFSFTLKAMLRTVGRPPRSKINLNIYFVKLAKLASKTRSLDPIISSSRKATELRPPTSYRKSFKVSEKNRRGQNEFTGLKKS